MLPILPSSRPLLQLAKEQDDPKKKPAGLSATERVPTVLRHGESGARERNGKLGGGAADAADTAAAAAGGPKKPTLLKRLTTKSSLKVEAASGGGGGGAASGRGESIRDMAASTAGMSAAERMQELNSRKGEMSEEEFQAERQKIIQAV